MNRVVITGLGVVNSSASGLLDFNQSLISGLNKPTLQQLKHQNTRFYSYTISDQMFSAAKQVTSRVDNSSELTAHLSSKDFLRLNRFCILGLIAAIQAYKSSNFFSIRNTTVSDSRAGANICFSIGGLEKFESTFYDYLNKSKQISPYFILQSMPQIISSQACRLFNFTGPSETTSASCSASLHSIGAAYRMIAHNEIDFALAGGAESALSDLSWSSFSSIGAISTLKQSEKSCRPFDKDRDGLVLGEGAAVIALENLDSALSRNANILAELVSYASSTDIQSVVQPAVESIKNNILLNLKKANLSFQDIDAVWAHATSTQVGDASEIAALDDLLTQNNRQTPLYVTAIKSHVGHLLGAAGATDVVSAVLSLQNSYIPAVLNTEDVSSLHRSPLLKINLKKTDIKLNSILINSFGFGGSQSSLILKKYITE